MADHDSATRGLADTEQDDAIAIGVDTATSNRNLAGTVVGTCLAVLTFLLFFLYPRYLSGEIDAAMFQLTLIVIIFAVFSFSYSGLYYYGLMISLSTKDGRARTNLAIADATLILGILLIALEPAMIFLTLRLTEVGVLAAALWVSFLFFTLHEARRRRYENSAAARIETRA